MKKSGIVILSFLFMSIFLSSPLSAALKRIKVKSQTGDGSTKEIQLYSGYHALVVGVGEYHKGWPPLPNPVNDAREVAVMLKSMNWTVDVLENPDGKTLRSALNQLVAGEGQKKEKAILFWYSGHGYTIGEADGTKLGYLIPVDAPDPEKDLSGFMDQAVSMRQIETVAKQILSKHVLMIFDSCFSGAIFQMVRAKPSSYIQEKVSFPVREFITAGTEKEQVPDKSIFKQVFIQGIKDGFADLNQDSYVTGEELGAYLQEQVINYSRKAQHPQFGRINNPKLDKGDFVFVKPVMDELTIARREVVRLKRENELLIKLVEQKKERKGRLFVNTEPIDARVKVLNIRSKFYQGMELIRGRYHVEVSADGHETAKKWVDVVADENKMLTINLNRIQTTITKAAPVAPAKVTSKVDQTQVHTPKLNSVFSSKGEWKDFTKPLKIKAYSLQGNPLKIKVHIPAYVIDSNEKMPLQVDIDSDFLPNCYLQVNDSAYFDSILSSKVINIRATDLKPGLNELKFYERTTIGTNGPSIIYGFRFDLTDIVLKSAMSKIGKGRQIKVVVDDKRKRKKVTGYFEWNINENPSKLVKTALRKALVASGFNVFQSGSIEYNAKIEEFSLDWDVGSAMPVTATISLNIQIKSINGDLIAEKRISNSASELFGNNPSLSDAKSVLRKCLNKLVKKAVQDSTLNKPITRSSQVAAAVAPPQITSKPEQPPARAPEKAVAAVSKATSTDSSSDTDSRPRLVILPWKLLGTAQGWNFIAIDALEKAITETRIFSSLLSYYDLGNTSNAKSIDKNILNDNIAAGLWARDSSTPNIDLFIKLGHQLKADAVFTSYIHVLPADPDAGRITVFVIDVKTKKIYKAGKYTDDYDLNGFNLYYRASKEVLTRYRTSSM